jgi:uncharacterized protein (DUF488 family)
MLRVFTVGHSTRSADEFMRLLAGPGILQVADVRSVPRSRRHPHFGMEALAASLALAGIGYRHFPVLGGLRRPRPDSPNKALTNPGFRAYADHMQTAAFARGVDDLLQYAALAPTAVMCAEAVWWRCHRHLLADALLVRRVEVRHIVSHGAAAQHRLHRDAHEQDGLIVYSGPA